MYTALYIGGSSLKEISLHESFEDAVIYLYDWLGLVPNHTTSLPIYDQCEREAKLHGWDFYIAIDVPTPDAFGRDDDWWEPEDNFDIDDEDHDEGEW